MRLGEFASFACGYLASLAEADPVFRTGTVYAHRLRKSVPFGLEDPAAEQRLIEFLDKPDDRKYEPPQIFSDRDDRGRTTAASTHPSGMTMVFRSEGSRAEQLQVILHDGNWGPSLDVANAIVDLPEKGSARYRSAEFGEALLRRSVAYLRPSGGWFSRSSFNLAVRSKGDYNLIGWLAYFGWAGVIDHLPGDVQAERIPPGGVLVRLHGSSFDPANPDQDLLHEAFRIRDLLRGFTPAGQRLGDHPNYMASAPNSEIIGRGLPATMR